MTARFSQSSGRGARGSATKERPDIDLFVADREHPSLHGTYLATVVVYATIFGEDPGNLMYVPSGITPEAGAFLRRTAWNTLLQYRATR